MIKYRKVLIGLVIFFIIGYLYNYNQISKFKINKIEIRSKKINRAIKITQISDFHSNSLIDLEKLGHEIEIFDPDLIVLTGDIIDAKDQDFSSAFNLFEKLSTLNKDIYFIHGNHEMFNSLYDKFRKGLEEAEIIILEDTSIALDILNERINLIGLNYEQGYIGYGELDGYNRAIEGLDQEAYNIVLAHDPSQIRNSLKGSEDLILSGHTHGGQVRIPIVGPIVAPGQGFFPELDKGIFKIDDTILYIDSGLGNSLAPLRALNPVQFTNIILRGDK